jgi:hypothetical protein
MKGMDVLILLIVIFGFLWLWPSIQASINKQSNTGAVSFGFNLPIN